MSEDEEKRLTFKPKSEEELKEIAKDLHAGRIFTDRHVPEGQNDLIGSVFMLLPLGALAGYPKEDLAKIGLIYEYVDKAGPMSINGYPSFFSFRILSIEDTDKVFDYAQKIEEALSKI